MGSSKMSTHLENDIHYQDFFTIANDIVNRCSKSRNPKNQQLHYKNGLMHIIFQIHQNQYYKYHLKQKVSPITIYQLVRQKMSQKMKSKDTIEKNGCHLINLKIFNLGYGK